MKKCKRDRFAARPSANPELVSNGPVPFLLTSRFVLMKAYPNKVLTNMFGEC